MGLRYSTGKREGERERERREGERESDGEMAKTMLCIIISPFIL